MNRNGNNTLFQPEVYVVAGDPKSKHHLSSTCVPGLISSGINQKVAINSICINCLERKRKARRQPKVMTINHGKKVPPIHRLHK